MSKLGSASYIKPYLLRGLYNSLDASHCIEVLQSAIATYGSPEIINSDLDFIQSQAGKQAIIDTHVEGIIVKNLNIA